MTITYLEIDYNEADWLEAVVNFIKVDTLIQKSFSEFAFGDNLLKIPKD